MSPSSKLVSNNWRTFLKVDIALVFISKLEQEKALQQPASFLNAIFRAIVTATSPQAPSTKSAVIESHRCRILSSLMCLGGNHRWTLGLGILPFWRLNTSWNKILWYDFFLLGDVLFVGVSTVSAAEAFSSNIKKISLRELILLIYFWSMEMSQQKTARMLSMINNLVCKCFRSLEDVCSLDIDNPFVPFWGAAVIKCDESKFNHKAKVKRIMHPVSFSPINTKAETFLFSLIDCKFSGFRKVADPYILFHYPTVRLILYSWNFLMARVIRKYSLSW